MHVRYDYHANCSALADSKVEHVTRVQLVNDDDNNNNTGMENIELARKIEERERLKSLKLKQTPQEEPADQKVKKETRFERK